MLCDLFEVNLNVCIRTVRVVEYMFYTDLPAGTQVSMSCTRHFYDYSDEKRLWNGSDAALTVMPSVHGDFNGGRGEVDIEASDLMALERFRKIRSGGFSAGIKSQVSNTLQFGFVVGARQRIRDFGKNNCNLAGEMVQNSGGINVVSVGKSVEIPMRPDLQPLLGDEKH